MKGFSLLEVLLSTFLLSTGVAALIGMLGIGVFAHLQANNQSIALNLAQEKIEELRNFSFPAIVSQDRAFNEPQLGVFGSSFDREVVVTNETGDLNLKRIEVFVYWTTKGQEINVNLISLKANRE